MQFVVHCQWLMRLGTELSGDPTIHCKRLEEKSYQWDNTRYFNFTATRDLNSYQKHADIIHTFCVHAYTVVLCLVLE